MAKAFKHLSCPCCGSPNRGDSCSYCGRMDYEKEQTYSSRGNTEIYDELGPAPDAVTLLLMVIPIVLIVIGCSL